MNMLEAVKVIAQRGYSWEDANRLRQEIHAENRQLVIDGSDDDGYGARVYDRERDIEGRGDADSPGGAQLIAFADFLLQLDK